MGEVMDEPSLTWGIIDDAIEEWAKEAGDALPPNLIGLWDDNLRKDLSKHILRHLKAALPGLSDHAKAGLLALLARTPTEPRTMRGELVMPVEQMCFPPGPLREAISEHGSFSAIPD